MMRFKLQLKTERLAILQCRLEEVSAYEMKDLIHPQISSVNP
jgi:hypothetical protein